MTRLTYYRVKNVMLISTLVSNLIGVAIVRYFTQRSSSLLLPDILRIADQIDKFFLPASFILPFVLILVYERPIRAYFERRYRQKPLPAALIFKARQRLLNEPFFLIGLSFSMWMSAAAIYPGMFWAHNAGPVAIRIAFLRSLYTGLITITVAFFVLEFYMQRRVVPHLFPNGGLSAIPGTVRIRIRTKLIAFLFACNIVPLVSILLSTYGKLHGDESLIKILGQFQSDLVIEVFVFLPEFCTQRTAMIGGENFLSNPLIVGGNQQPVRRGYRWVSISLKSSLTYRVCVPFRSCRKILAYTGRAKR